MKKSVLKFYKLQLSRGYIALEQPQHSNNYIAFEHSQHLRNYIYCLNDHNTQAILPMLKVVSVLEALQVSFPTPKVISSAPGNSNDLLGFLGFSRLFLVFCKATNPIFVVSLIQYIWIFKIQIFGSPNKKYVPYGYRISSFI